MPRKDVGEPTLCSTKITGQIMFALDLRVSALGSNSLAGNVALPEMWVLVLISGGIAQNSDDSR